MTAVVMMTTEVGLARHCPLGHNPTSEGGDARMREGSSLWRRSVRSEMQGFTKAAIALLIELKNASAWGSPSWEKLTNGIEFG